MNDVMKLWQQRAIEMYETRVCDMSFDHISVDVGIGANDEPKLHDIHELGYDKCPKCHDLAPIVNLNLKQPKKLIKLCDCGYESVVNRPELIRAYLKSQ